MKKLKRLLFIAIAATCLITVNAQNNPEFIFKVNMGIGMDYNQLEFDNIDGSGELAYSPGGGMGIEIGAEQYMLRNLEVYGTLGYQQNLAMQIYTSNTEGTDKTSFTFNRKTLLLGSNYRINLPSDKVTALKIGGGGSYNIPGKMHITELNERYGHATFKPSMGYVVELGIDFYFNSKWDITTSLRYRNINFSLKEYNEPINGINLGTEHYHNFEEYIEEINASGVDLSVTLKRKKYANPFVSR